MQGTVKGGRRQSRHKKRWEDNIRKRTGLEFAKSQRAVESREKWRKLVAKSSVVPQRPSWLGDGRDERDGVVPKGLFTFLGSLYKEVAKTTSGTLLCRVERQTARKKSFEKHCVLDLKCRILSLEPSDKYILYFDVIFHGK